MMEMSRSAAATTPPLDLDDLGDRPVELLEGAVVEKASPSFEHGDCQGSLLSLLRGPFHRRSGGGGPGGWWIATEVDVALGPTTVIRPDLVGWRRARLPGRPSGWSVTARPDWVCEVLSPSTAQRDQVVKAAILHRAGVPHYWLVDPERRTLTVLRWTEAGWLIARAAGGDDRVAAEPFEAIALDLAALFGLAEPDPEPPAP